MEGMSTFVRSGNVLKGETKAVAVYAAANNPDEVVGAVTRVQEDFHMEETEALK